MGITTRGRVLSTVGLVVLLVAASAIGPLAWGQLRDALAQGAGSAKPVTVPITPFRLVDTRPAPDDPGGGPNEPFGQGETRTFQVAGVQTVPAGAIGVVLNITALGATAESFVTVFPGGSSIPNASTLNPFPGRTVFNSATVLLGAGKFSVFHNAGSVHLIIDVVGYLVDHDHDERYLEQTAPIVMGLSSAGFGIVPGTGPSSTQVAGGTLSVSADGIISLPFDAPASVGGTSYQLARFEYCVTIRTAGALVGAVAITSDALTNNIPLTLIVNDATDRTASGCYTVNAPASTARSFGVIMGFGGNAMASSIYLTGIRTVWNPVPGSQSIVEPAPVEGLEEFFGPGALAGLGATG